MIKQVLVAGALAATMMNSAVAQADVGGNVPGPGLCDYPGVGITFFVQPLLGQADGYYCRFPKEINGSYWVQAYGSYVIGGGAAGPNGGSVALGAGGGGGKTGFWCLENPDDPIAFVNAKRSRDPDPPGAWKNKIGDKATDCRTIDEPPQGSSSIPDDVKGLGAKESRSNNPALDQGPDPMPADQFATGSPTNPGSPNPLKTEQDHP